VPLWRVQPAMNSYCSCWHVAAQVRLGESAYMAALCTAHAVHFATVFGALGQGP
jgi:hypothetical protein